MPNWDEIVRFCIDAHEDRHLIGWDVFQDKDSIILIEQTANQVFHQYTIPKKVAI